MTRPRYNPACETCTYAWCCGRCYCCHPGPVFRIHVDDPSPVFPPPPGDETPVDLGGGLFVPKWLADRLDEYDRQPQDGDGGPE